MNAAIFTIGTEIVDGEIVNTNAAWLAQQLDGYGLTVTHHVSTSDDEADMREVLSWLVEKVDWVFVSGGLGPTSDDRTRDVVAAVIDDELVFDEEVWRRLGESYRARGFTVTDDHRRQCLFPARCRQLENPVGSALGFMSRAGDTTVVVLPGPPRELKAVFARGVEADIRALGLRKAVLYRWACLGVTESGAAERVEAAIGDEGLEIGYRADIPYVHVKVWIPEDRPVQPILDHVNEAIGRFTVATGVADPAAGLVAALAARRERHFEFSDSLSGGALVRRLEELGVLAAHSVAVTSRPVTAAPEAGCLLLTLAADEDQAVWATLRGEASPSDDPVMQTRLPDPPYTVDLANPRARRYYAEQALHAWAAMLRS